LLETNLDENSPADRDITARLYGGDEPMRIRRLMAEQGCSFATAREASVIGNIFTIHTTVAAGNDWFPADLVESHLSHFREALGLSR